MLLVLFYFYFYSKQCCSKAILIVNENLNVICKVISKIESSKLFVMFVICQVIRKCRINVYGFLILGILKNASDVTTMDAYIEGSRTTIDLSTSLNKFGGLIVILFIR